MLLVAGNIDPGNQWDDRNWFTVIGSECLFGQFGELSKDCFNLSSDFLTFLTSQFWERKLEKLHSKMRINKERWW